MDTSKIKNILIIILAAVNVFLLAAVVSDRAKMASAGEAAWEDAIRAVESRGVKVSDDVDGRIGTPTVYSVHRDAELEGEMLRRVLGRTEKSDLGGNILFYNSEKGQASLRGTGEMDILFSAGTFRGNDRVKTAARAMKKLELETNTELAVSNAAENMVTLPCCWKGGTVYNLRMGFTFSGGELMMLSGTRVFDKVVKESSADTVDELSAMMRFVEVLSAEGYVCSELQALELGYSMSVAVSGESMLTPIWRFITDAGSLYLNAVTGQRESFE